MPATSRKQRRFMGAELRRKREGKRTRTGMSERQLREFAATKDKGLPERKKEKGGGESHAYDFRKQRGRRAPMRMRSKPGPGY